MTLDLRLDAGTAAARLPEPFVKWFAERGWSPRAHQIDLLGRAEAGCSVLLIAPTGAGKTLAGFLPSLAELSTLASAVLDSAPGFWPWIVASALVQLSNAEERAARAAFDRMAATHFLTVPRDRFWTITMTVAAELCASFDDGTRSAEILELIEPFAGRVAVLGFGQVCGGSMARSAGRLRATLGDWDAAEVHFGTAMRANVALGALTWVAWTELNYAEMLLRRGAPGDSARARALLTSAAKTARECGMAGALADAERLLGRC